MRVLRDLLANRRRIRPGWFCMKKPRLSGAINHAVKGRDVRDQITLAIAGIRLS